MAFFYQTLHLLILLARLDVLKDSGFECIDHSLYSIDLDPSDYFQILKLKRSLKRKKCSNNSEQYFNVETLEFLLEWMKKLEKWCAKCWPLCWIIWNSIYLSWVKAIPFLVLPRTFQLLLVYTILRWMYVLNCIYD